MTHQEMYEEELLHIMRFWGCGRQAAIRIHQEQERKFSED